MDLDLVCDGWMRAHDQIGEKSEPRTPTHGRRNNLPHSWASLAEHLGGRMVSSGVRELSRFLTRMAT